MWRLERGDSNMGTRMRGLDAKAAAKPLGLGA